MKNELSSAKMSLFLIVVLTMLHIGTIFRQYYSFYITVAAFLCVLLFQLSASNSRLEISKSDALYCVVMMGLIALGWSKGISVTTSVGRFLPLIIWPYFFSVVYRSIEVRQLAKYKNFLLLVTLMSSILTLRVLVRDSVAARLLAGAASDEQFAIYYNQGVGGYGFIFGLTFFVYALLLYREHAKGIVGKAIIVLSIVLSYITLFFSSYTTAILLSVVLLGIYMYQQSNSNVGMILVLFLAGIVILFRVPLMRLVVNIADQMDLFYVSNRFSQLIGVSDGGSVSDLKRYSLYSESFQSFLSNPIFGGDVVGGHSFAFDLLGQYGITGLLFLYLTIKRTLNYKRYCTQQQSMVYYAVVLFMLIDTVDTIVFLPYVFFVLPLFLLKEDDLDYECNADYLI